MWFKETETDREREKTERETDKQTVRQTDRPTKDRERERDRQTSTDKFTNLRNIENMEKYNETIIISLLHIIITVMHNTCINHEWGFGKSARV